MEKRKKMNLKKAGAITAVAFFIVMVSSGITIYEQVNPETEKMEYNIKFEGALAEYSGAGADESAWLEIYAMPHDVTPVGNFDTNTSGTLEAAALAYADTDGWSEDLISETSFDIVVRVRFNATHAKNSTMFKDTRCRCNLTVAGNWAVGSDFSDSLGASYVTQNVSTEKFIWINYYWNNSGTGYQMEDGGTLTVSAPKLEAKY